MKQSGIGAKKDRRTYAVLYVTTIRFVWENRRKSINGKGAEDDMAAKIDKKNCTGCGKCVEVCPVAAIKVEKEKAVVGSDCVECGACVGECPSGAISIPR